MQMKGKWHELSFTRMKRHYFIQRILTFFVIVLTWIFFRDDSVAGAFEYIASIFSLRDWLDFDWKVCSAIGILPIEMNILMISVAILFLVDFACWKKKLTFAILMQRCPLVVRWAGMLILLFFCIVYGIYGPEFDASQFIYFQF